MVLLDNRYNLDPWDYAGTDPSRRVLGEEQWAWLRERLARACHRPDHRERRPGRPGLRHRSRRGRAGATRRSSGSASSTLVRELRIPGVVFVSGDMHFAALTRHPDMRLAIATRRTTSGERASTRARQRRRGQWDNPNRVGELLNTYRKHGLIEIDWAFTDPEIHLEL